MERIKAAFGGLDVALKALGESLAAGAKRSRELREVGALFDLRRQARALDCGGGLPERNAEERRERQAEIDAITTTAIDGYDTELLAELIVFGEWLTATARPVWESRTR